mgnify:FL=1
MQVERSAKVVIVMLWIVLYASLVVAEPVSVQIIEAADEVEAGSDAVFKILITNNRAERDVFKIVGDDFAIYPFSDFASLIIAEPAQV